jgi:hypothetical protein
MKSDRNATRFGGIGTEILMHKTQFEIEADHVDALMKQIGDQDAVVANAYDALSKIFRGDLQKLAGATDLNKNLILCKALLGKANEEITKPTRCIARRFAHRYSDIERIANVMRRKVER